MIDIEESAFSLLAYGSEAYIQSKSKKTKLDSANACHNIADVTTGTTRISTGKRSIITINCGSKPGDLENKGSTLTLAPESEAEIFVESWSSTVGREHHHGKIFSKIKLIRGVFTVSTSGSVSTPTAILEPLKKASPIMVEIKADNSTVFGTPLTPLRVKCTSTGASKEMQSKIGSAEVIVTKDGIYKKSMVDLDERFTRMQLLVSTLASFAAMSSATLTESEMARVQAQQSAAGASTFNSADVIKALAQFRTLDPKTIPGVTPEQRRQIEEAQKDMAYMEKKSGKKTSDEFTAAMKQWNNAMQNPKMADAMKNFPKMMQEAGQKANVNLESSFEEYEKLPPYPPLHKDFKIA